MAPDVALNLRLFSPELGLLGFLLVLFGIDAVVPKARENRAPLYLILLACVVSVFLTCGVAKPEFTTLFFSGMVANDSFTAFFRYLFLFVLGATAYFSFGSKELAAKSRMELSLLLICATIGLSVMAMSTNLLILYIGIETVSIVSFVLAGFHREDLKSNEASFKYLVFGAMSSGIMIYGFSLLYGYTGSLQYSAIGKFLVENPAGAPGVLKVALIMVYGGLAYKISAFPMHFWTPDVYEGSPTPIAAFFSVGPKAAGFAALVRLIKDAFSLNMGPNQWKPLDALPLMQSIAVVSALTMVVGNLSAIGQTNVKRLLAYSSIAHVGYMLMGLISYDVFGLSAVLFYLVAYYAMNFGAFWVVSIVADIKGGDDLEHFRGIGWSMPVLGVCMAFFLFSLTGIPLFAGFIGKFLLFTAVMKTPGFLWLAVLGVLNSVISLYYYSKILKAMWLEKPEAQVAPEKLSLYHGVGLVALAIPTIVLGLYFTPILELAERSLAAIL